MEHEWDGEHQAGPVGRAQAHAIAARSLREWLTSVGAGERGSVLRERQWLRPSACGEIIVMPECFRSGLWLPTPPSTARSTP